MSASNTTSKIGAVFYIIWACLHLLAAYSVYVLGRSLDSSMVQGRLFQDAWNLLFFSIIAVFVAVTLNWRNSVWSYWINFATVGIADTGLSSSFLSPVTDSHHSVICGRAGVGELHTPQPSADSHKPACCTIVASPSC